jgi:uncharacterized protein
MSESLFCLFLFVLSVVSVCHLIQKFPIFAPTNTHTMKYKGRETSGNVEDRRAGGGSRMIPGGLPGKMGAGLGVGGIIVAAIIYFMGGDPSALMGGGNTVADNSAQPNGAQTTGNQAEDELATFVSVVLKDTEDAWNIIFRDQLNETYQLPVLVLFRDEVSSACGNAGSSTGPFYCSGDQKLYIDLSFYEELKNKFGAAGDFAMAYVVAHEVGHHVQHLLGTSGEVHQRQRSLSKEEGNKLSVRLELQADFYAGVWAHHAQKMKNILEPGDIEEALRAANAIGDDKLQMQGRGYVVPESFTHGTSEQRVRWFRKGFDSGKMSDGNTFAARSL